MATMDIAGRNAEEDAAVARVDGSPQASAAVSIGRAEGRCGDEAGAAGGIEAVAEEA